MMQRFLRFPWGRTFCVIGAIGAFLALQEGTDGAASALATFIFAGTALHGIAVWRDKP